MRAMRLHRSAPVEQKPLLLEEVPVPELKPGEVLIRVSTCGVCHTDLHIVEGEIRPPALPIIPGHQVVGVVEALHESFKNTSAEKRGVQLGQRVGLPWLFSACGECDYCLNGQENLCAQARFTGFHVNGGYGEYLAADYRFVLPIPASLSDIQAAPMLCAGIIGYRSLRLADLKPGERLGLVGFGGSAHLALQIANYWNCRVYVFTRTLEHRQHAEQLGAVWAGAIEDDPQLQMDRMVIFAPAGRLVPLSLQKLRPGGTLAINAIYMSPIPEMPYHLLYGERTIRSVSNATYQDGKEFLELAAKIPVRATTNPYDLKDANQALHDLKQSRLNGEAVLLIH